MNLLARATSLLPGGSEQRELLCELAIGLSAAGRSDEAEEVLSRVVEDAVAATDRVVEVRARLELEYVRLPRTALATGDALLNATSTAIPVLEAAGDDRWLGRAWRLAGWIHGGRRGQHKMREEAAERALLHYKRSTWPTSTSAGEIANALYYGPTPVPEAIERCEELLRTDAATRYGRANIDVFLGGLLAQQGDFELARTLISSAKATYDELGHRASAATNAAAILGDVLLLQDDVSAAEETLRWLCKELARTHAFSHLASRAGDLAEALYRQGRVDDAAEWVAVAEKHSAVDDIDARLLWTPVRAKIAAQRGDFEEAVAIASDAVGLADTTDGLNRRAAVQMDSGEVLLLAGRRGEAAVAFDRAIQFFEEKGNVVGAARVRAVHDDRAVV